MLRHRRIELEVPSIEDITQDVVTRDIKIKTQIQVILFLCIEANCNPLAFRYEFHMLDLFSSCAMHFL